MAEPEEPEFDFGKKKSSKKKKEKKDKEAGDGSGGGGAVVGDSAWQKGDTYTYEEVLDRLFQIIEDQNPTFGTVKKYVMKPPQIVRVGSKKIGWVNFSEICEMMKRPTDHVVTFVLAEFGTEGSIGGDGQLILRGRYETKHAESLLRKYIKGFVTCEMCKSADTELTRDSSSRLYMVTCHRCGAARTASSIKSGYKAVTRADRKAAKAAG